MQSRRGLGGMSSARSHCSHEPIVGRSPAAYASVDFPRDQRIGQIPE